MRKVTIEGREFTIRGLKRKEVRALKKEGINHARLGLDKAEEAKNRLFELILSPDEARWLDDLKVEREVIADDRIIKFQRLSAAEIERMKQTPEFKALDNEDQVDWILERVLSAEQLAMLEDLDNRYSVRIYNQAIRPEHILEIFKAAMKETFGDPAEEKN